MPLCRGVYCSVNDLGAGSIVIARIQLFIFHGDRVFFTEPVEREKAETSDVTASAREYVELLHGDVHPEETRRW